MLRRVSNVNKIGRSEGARHTGRAGVYALLTEKKGDVVAKSVPSIPQALKAALISLLICRA